MKGLGFYDRWVDYQYCSEVTYAKEIFLLFSIF